MLVTSQCLAVPMLQLSADAECCEHATRMWLPSLCWCQLALHLSTAWINRQHSCSTSQHQSIFRARGRCGVIRAEGGLRKGKIDLGWRWWQVLLWNLNLTPGLGSMTQISLNLHVQVQIQGDQLVSHLCYLGYGSKVTPRRLPTLAWCPLDLEVTILAPLEVWAKRVRYGLCLYKKNGILSYISAEKNICR